MADSIAQTDWPTHTTVYREGTTLQRLFVVCCGLAALQHISVEGHERSIRLVEPGDVMGLEGLAGSPAQSIAVTLLASTICSIPIDLLLRQAHDDVGVSDHLHRLWLTALSRADFVIADLSTGSARARVSRLLLHLSALGGPNVVPDLTRQDMAALMSLTTETVSRVMAIFQRNGTIRQHRGRLVCNLALLNAELASD